MGGFKSIGKAVKKAVDKAGGGTRILSYVAPYTALATTKGRAELMKTYGPVVNLASAYVGGGAGGAVSAAGEIFSGQAQPQDAPQEQQATIYTEGAGGGGGSPFAAFNGNAGSFMQRNAPWIIGGAVVALGALLLIRFRK